MTTSAKDKIAALRAQYRAPAKGEGAPRDQAQSNFYPFWNMKPGQRVVVRFLPDLDESNQGFLVEKSFHTLSINGQNRSVPDLAMYGESDPISELSQKFYKAGDQVNGKKYWRKKQYLAQVLIVEDPLPADATTGEKATGQVKFLSLGYQIYNIIKEAIASEDPDEALEAMPSDFHEGYDFVIKKTEQGEYSTYTMGTKFLSRQRALTDEEMLTAKEGMVDLKTLLPKNPGREKVQAMLDASLNGDSFDESAAAPAAKPAVPASRRPVVEEEDPPFDADPAPARKATPAPADDGDDDDADAILAQIRQRRQASRG